MKQITLRCSVPLSKALTEIAVQKKVSRNELINQILLKAISLQETDTLTERYTEEIRTMKEAILDLTAEIHTLSRHDS